MNSEQFRITRFMWAIVGIVLVVMTATTTWTGLGVGHIILGSLLCLGAVAGTIAIWATDHNPSSAEQAAKSKGGDRVAHLLDQLSDEDLARLREHLEDSAAEYGLGQDGEWVRLKRRR